MVRLLCLLPHCLPSDVVAHAHYRSTSPPLRRYGVRYRAPPYPDVTALSMRFMSARARPLPGSVVCGQWRLREDGNCRRCRHSFSYEARRCLVFQADAWRESSASLSAAITIDTISVASCACSCALLLPCLHVLHSPVRGNDDPTLFHRPRRVAEPCTPAAGQRAATTSVTVLR
jgi:hypothetical protein